MTNSAVYNVSSRNDRAAESVVAVYGSLAQAEQAVHVLRRAGFPIENVSLIAPGLPGGLEFAEGLRIGDDSVRDAAIGAGLGGVLGLLAGIGFLTMSGLGVVFVAGSLAMGLTGMTVGAFLGSFVGWGIHEDHARHYERCVKNGMALVIANGNPLEMVHVDRILKETDATEVHLHASASDDSAEVSDG